MKKVQENRVDYLVESTLATSQSRRSQTQPSQPSRTIKATKFYAKLFANGRSQAVRLPREFRMAGTEVLISREGKKIILTPMPAPPLDANGWPIDFWKDLDLLSDRENFPDPDPLPVGFDDVAVAASTSRKRGRT